MEIWSTFLLEAGKWYVEVKATEQGSGENGRFFLQPAEGGEFFKTQMIMIPLSMLVFLALKLMLQIRYRLGSAIFTDFTRLVVLLS